MDYDHAFNYVFKEFNVHNDDKSIDGYDKVFVRLDGGQ